MSLSSCVCVIALREVFVCILRASKPMVEGGILLCRNDTGLKFKHYGPIHAWTMTDDQSYDPAGCVFEGNKSNTVETRGEEGNLKDKKRNLNRCYEAVQNKKVHVR